MKINSLTTRVAIMDFDADLKNFQNKEMPPGHEFCLASMKPIKWLGGDNYLSHQLKYGIRQIYWFCMMSYINEQYEFIEFDIRNIAAYTNTHYSDTVVNGKDKVSAVSRFLKQVIRNYPSESLIEIISNSSNDYICGKRKEPSYDGCPF